MVHSSKLPLVCNKCKMTNDRRAWTLVLTLKSEKRGRRALRRERIVCSEWGRESIHNFHLQALVVLTNSVARLGTSKLEKGSYELPKRMRWRRLASRKMH